uniref:Eukaryotic elongation factor 2 lysine methyltransferase n=1 Tax=Chrysemys picta bellii TaxID=8478 RepID=A0A8C3IV48_CHRPI|nr:protein-lysine N-methyltransferase EEF2KMT isoform X2 [Chrysemys picta bellii]
MDPAAEEARHLGLRFQRGFLAGRRLSAFPWAELEKKLKSSSDALLLLDILQKHESIATEPLDELYDVLADILNKEESTTCYKSYLLPTGDSVTLSETVAIISQGTTGLVTWDAALYLAEWAIENSAIFSNRTILELGSGIGLTGIAICKTCNPKAYVFSDYHHCVLEQLRENIHLNGFVLESETGNHTKMQSQNQRTEVMDLQGPKITAAELDWDSVTKEQLSQLQVDVVIAADVVYDPQITSSLISVLQQLSASKTAGKPPEIYIAFTVRNPDTYHLFQTELGKVGIGWQVVPTHTKNLFLYDLHSNITLLKLLAKTL